MIFPCDEYNVVLIKFSIKFFRMHYSKHSTIPYKAYVSNEDKDIAWSPEIRILDKNLANLCKMWVICVFNAASNWIHASNYIVNAYRTYANFWICVNSKKMNAIFSTFLATGKIWTRMSLDFFELVLDGPWTAQFGPIRGGWSSHLWLIKCCLEIFVNLFVKNWWIYIDLEGVDEIQMFKTVTNCW